MSSHELLAKVEAEEAAARTAWLAAEPGVGKDDLKEVWRACKEELVQLRQSLAAGTSTGAGSLLPLASNDVASLADAVAERMKAHLKVTQQALQDDINSWHSSHTTEASRLGVSEAQLLRRLLRVRITPFDDGEPSSILHPAAYEDDFDWDNTPEPSQRQAYMETIMSNVQLAAAQRVIVWKTQIKAAIMVKGLGHRVVAKSDELLVARRWASIPDAGCIIGIELKKNLSQASRRQGEAEFYTFSLTSNFPFLQLVTDMQRGGFAYWKTKDDDGQQVVMERVLKGMGSFYAFLNEAIASLPSGLSKGRGDVHVPQQLSAPQRCKLVDPLINFAMRAAASEQDEPDCGDDALDELGAWFGKAQLDAMGELPDASIYTDQAHT